MAGRQFHHLKVVNVDQFGHATVELNGEEIQNGARRLDLCLESGELNTATLELLAPTVEVDGEFQVHLAEETQALLKQLGWTPPQEATS